MVAVAVTVEVRLRLRPPAPTGHDGWVRRLVLSVTCPDRTGIVAAVTGFIASHGGWVVEAAQHGDLATGRFFQRIEILAESLAFGPEEFGGLLRRDRRPVRAWTGI